MQLGNAELHHGCRHTCSSKYMQRTLQPTENPVGTLIVFSVPPTATRRSSEQTMQLEIGNEMASVCLDLSAVVVVFLVPAGRVRSVIKCSKMGSGTSRPISS